MAAGVSRVVFTEANDARPTYFCCATATALFAVSQLFRQTGSHSTGLNTLALLTTGLATSLGATCIMGCIWHPIPKGRRRDGQLTTLRLADSPEAGVPTQENLMFSSLDDQVSKDDDEAVGASEIEVRNPIQWRALCLTFAAVGFNIMLALVLGH